MDALLRPRIAVFAGATATILHALPLVTSNKARAKYGLPPVAREDGGPLRFDGLRPQRLAAPVTVFVEQFSGHPLELDAAELYGPPDGYLDIHGVFHTVKQAETDRPVFEVTLQPEDGLYLLPYMARQADGSAWEEDAASPHAALEATRQPYFPDAARLFEEIDRFGLDSRGKGSLLAAKADYDFYRVAPSAGYIKGLAASSRTDVGEGDIAPEGWGDDFFEGTRRDPPRTLLAKVANTVQRALDTGKYAGAIWLEGSPNIEETLYWLNLMIDTPLPICGNSSQRPHGALANDGDRNIVDSVDYILSGVWKDDSGRDGVGVVAVLDEQVFTARELQKGDSRPGGYLATGGHGGVVGRMGRRPPALTFRPMTRHTHTSAVNLRSLSAAVNGVLQVDGRLTVVPVAVKDAGGNLLPTAIPDVRFVKSARYLPPDTTGSPASEVEIAARITQNLLETPLAGFVAEGQVGGMMVRPMTLALERAVFSGMPVVSVSRGNPEGFAGAGPDNVFISGSNLTANKARWLLLACLLKFGSLPPAVDPAHPTTAERSAVKAKLAEYQAVFDTH